MAAEQKYEKEKLKKVAAIAVTFILVVVILWAIFTSGRSKTEMTATIEDLMATTSTRASVNVSSMIVDARQPLLAIAATPVCMYYNGAERGQISPLLAYNKLNPSRSVDLFVSQYGFKPVTAVGDVGDLNNKGFSIEKRFEGCLKRISIDMATTYWEQSSGAIVIYFDSQKGMQSEEGMESYGWAVNAGVLASYLNIPVLLAESMDSDVRGTLDILGVDYVIVLGKLDGYKKTFRFDNEWHVQNVTLQILKNRLKVETVQYMTLANYLDTYKLEVLEEKKFTFEGIAANTESAAYPGAAPSTTSGTPIHPFEIPEGYQYANLVVDLLMDTSQEKLGDSSGARIYCYIGKDFNNDDLIDETAGELQFFGGSPAYENIGPNKGDLTPNQYAHFYTELPFYNDTGPHKIQLLPRLPSDWGQYPARAEEGDYEAWYKVEIKVQKLASPTYPLMQSISCMAPYLTAYRLGIVLAREEFHLYNPGYIGCLDCGDPASNPNASLESNKKTLRIKEDINKLLGMIEEMPATNPSEISALAKKYADRPADKKMHLAILADTNMVPQYYYVSTGQGDATEGFGIPSDTIYQDIDCNPEDVPFNYEGGIPSFEIAAGRVDGWDNQDVSCLIARTFFYDEIIKDLRGPRNGVRWGTEPPLPELWKDSAYTSVGTEPPVGAAITASYKIGLAFQQAGFGVDFDQLRKVNRECTRQIAGPYYESSNFIFFCAHGFYYWYVPPAMVGSYGPMPPISAGGAFDVAHVKLMTFGPSVLWASSCVTGRIDGLQPYNCLSQAFLHSGFAAYVGATRSSWGAIVPSPDAQSGEVFGDLMAIYFWGYLTGYRYDKDSGMVQGVTPSDCTTGVALMLAKNAFLTHPKGGTDAGGSNDDTWEEFILHGDPAFNPYEPNHA